MSLTIEPPPRGRRAAKWLIGSHARWVGVLVGAAVLVLVQPASASNFGAPYANGPTHRYYLETSLNYAREYNTRQAMTYSLGNTIMSPVEVTTVSSTTDVLVRQKYVSTGQEAGWYAWAQCTAVTGNVCTRWIIVFNTYNPHGDYRAVACHEIGHTVALDHAAGKNKNYTSSNRSCMRGDPDHHYYSTHDKNHLKGRYGL